MFKKERVALFGMGTNYQIQGRQLDDRVLVI